MFRYIFFRFLQSLPTIFLVITVSFFLMRLAPGGPFSKEKKMLPEIEAKIKEVYNMNKPLFEQYTDYLFNVLRGDFGPSFKYKDFSVNELIYSGFPTSLELGLMAALLAFSLGIIAGAYAGLKKNTFVDYGLMGVSMFGIVIPNFVMAPILSLVFGVYLGILPVGGWQEGDWIYKILPVVSLALPHISYIARITRGSIIEVLNSNFILTAKAKGISNTMIMLRHALKPTLLPVVSYLGPAITGLVTGSVVIETIFGIPGIGRHFITGALNRDYTLVMGVVIFYSIIIILMNLIVDILYAFLDPKIKLH